MIQIFARKIDTKVEGKQQSNRLWTWSGYCWWKESCTTCDIWNPVNSGINHLSTGAGFLPSAISFLSLFLLPAYSIRDLLIPEMEINPPWNFRVILGNWLFRYNSRDPTFISHKLHFRHQFTTKWKLVLVQNDMSNFKIVQFGSKNARSGTHRVFPIRIPMNTI